MQRTHAILSAVGLAAIVLAAVAASDVNAFLPPQKAEVGPRPRLETGLVELRDDPTGWVGEAVSFVWQFDREVEAWNPYLGRFGVEDWEGYRGWADESFLWDPASYEDPAPFLFARRGSEVTALVSAAARFQRFRCEGFVREVFLDEPWIELVRVEPLEGFLTEGTILHVGRAVAFQADRNWGLALEQLERAGSAPLPEHAREELERLENEFRRERAAWEARLRNMR